jgi:hypothetical protein
MKCPLTIRTEQCVGSYNVIVSDNGRWLFKDGPYLHVTTAMEAGRQWAREYALAILREIGPDTLYSTPEEGETCMDMADGLNATWRPCGDVHAV